MGTNYYVTTNKCECCNRYDIICHIGKSSYGWAFSFRGYKKDNLISWKTWKEFLKDEELVIRDEYGDVITYNEFVEKIENHKSPNYVREDGHKNLSHNAEGKLGDRPWFNPDYDWDDEDGYSFTSLEFS